MGLEYHRSFYYYKRGKSKKIDGITIGPQFDDTDPFYLDGQRLIKNNAKDFATEKFSKIKNN